MLVDYMRMSSEGERQTTDLQRDALLGAGVDERHLFEDQAAAAATTGRAWRRPWPSCGRVTAWWFGIWIGWAGRCPICWRR